jgi:hypothetical protein
MTSCTCLYRGEGEWATCSVCSLKAQLQHERREGQELRAEVEALKARVKELEDMPLPSSRCPCPWCGVSLPASMVGGATTK